MPRIDITQHSRNVENPEAVFLAEYHGQRIKGDPAGFVGLAKDEVTEIWTDGTYHRTEDHNGPPTKPAASGNFWLAKAAARFACGYKVAATLKQFEEADRVARLPPKAGISSGWMGSEAGSRKYTPLHWLGWWEAKLAGSTVAESWLRFFDALVAASIARTAEGERVLWVGQRGALPGSHIAGWIDAYARWVRQGKDSTPIRKGNGWGYPRDFELLDLHGPKLRAWAIAGAGNKPPRGYTLRTAWNWLHSGNSCRAAWVEKTVNPNTPPMMAAVVDLLEGKLKWLPHEGGEKRIRGKKGVKGDKATCVFDPVAMTLHYEATKSRPSPVTLKLETGPLIWTRMAEDGSVTEMSVKIGNPAMPLSLAVPGAKPRGTLPLPPEPPDTATVPPVVVPAGATAVRVTVELRKAPGGSWGASVVSQEVIG